MAVVQARGGGRTAPRLVSMLIACLCLTSLLSVGCSEVPRLEDAFESDDALARAVLEGMARRDHPGLLALAVTKDEFEELVWPTLPVSRPEVDMPLDFVWQDTFTKSHAYLAQTLASVGGRRYELVRVEFDGPTTEHGTHEISRKSRLIVRDDGGQERMLRLFGSVIRQNGRSKVFSYITD